MMNSLVVISDTDKHLNTSEATSASGIALTYLYDYSLKDAATRGALEYDYE